MQLLNERNNVVVDFYPLKDWNNNTIENKMLKVVTLNGKTFLKRIVDDERYDGEVINRKRKFGFMQTDMHIARQYYDEHLSTFTLNWKLFI